MENLANGATRERVDFSRIKTSIPIPNLIEVQKKSYERFLQMDLLPGEREDTGLQSVFNSVFPISDFRGLSQLEFVDYAIGNWECKCGNLKGLHHLRSTCRNPSCGATIRTDPFHVGDVLCHRCGTFNKNIVTFCNRCGDPGGPAVEVRRGRVRRARHDLRRPAQGHHPPDRLRQGRRNRRQNRPRHQGAGGLLRRNSADDRQRHLHHQRHRARHRFAVAPLARRVLRARPGAGLLPRQDHSLSRKLGRVRIRQQESAVRPHRPQAQVLRHRVPARAGPEERRARSCKAFYNVSEDRHQGQEAVLESLRQPASA